MSTRDANSRWLFHNQVRAYNTASLLRLRKTGLTGSKRFSGDWLDSGPVAIAVQWPWPWPWLLER